MNARVWGRKTKMGLLAAAFAMSFALAPADARGPMPGADEEVTVTGCVIKGEDGGYVLTDVVPASIDVANRQAADDTTGTAGSPGAAPGASRVIYWLDDLEEDDDLPNYTGRRVEIRGELDGEVEQGEMEIERDGEWVKITIDKDDADAVETRLPLAIFLTTDSPVGTSGELEDGDDVELNINVRELDVQDVKIATGTCAR